MPRSWVEVRVEVPSSLVEGVSNFLIEQGSPGVVQEKVPGRSGRGRESVVAYFLPRKSFSRQRHKIQTYLASLRKSGGRFSLHCRILKEEKWAETWKANFKPFRVTPRLVIKPPWEDYQGKKEEVVIEIDPGMAFGTGTHPTTQMCLQALEELIPFFPRPPSVLDVGTGSGILAIAARKLGGGRILAVDIDPLAVESARKNATANRVKGQVRFRVGSSAGLRRVFDIVVANLLPQEILKIAPTLSRRPSSRGFLVVSGILRGQKKEITEAFSGMGLQVQFSKNLKSWVCLGLRPGKRQ